MRGLLSQTFNKTSGRERERSPILLRRQIHRKFWDLFRRNLLICHVFQFLFWVPEIKIVKRESKLSLVSRSGLLSWRSKPDNSPRCVFVTNFNIKPRNFQKEEIRGNLTISKVGTAPYSFPWWLKFPHQKFPNVKLLTKTLKTRRTYDWLFTKNF